MTPFPCLKCGACCLHAAAVPELVERGLIEEDGSCTLLDKDRVTCMAYEERPLVCRIDELGESLRLVDREAWRDENLRGCERLHLRVYGEPLEKEGESCQHHSSS